MGLGNSLIYLQEESLFEANGFKIPTETILGKSIYPKADLSAKVVRRLKASISMKRLLQFETRVFYPWSFENDMVLRQADVDTASWCGVLDEEIYMEQPEGFDDKSGRGCRLFV